MECMCCGSAAVTERRDQTAQGYRRYRCRDCGRQFNERSAGVLIVSGGHMAAGLASGVAQGASQGAALTMGTAGGLSGEGGYYVDSLFRSDKSSANASDANHRVGVRSGAGRPSPRRGYSTMC
jgi:hypothetical protein